MTRVEDRSAIARRGDPVWEIAELFPEQGLWSEQDYLALNTNRLVEFDNGMIEVLPVPKKTHQIIVLFLCEALNAFLAARKIKGLVMPAPYRLRIPSGKYREPDVLYLTAEQDAQSSEDFTQDAELVMEVVSADDPDRDYIRKRSDYASAGVPESGIVDYHQRLITVLELVNGQYVERGKSGAGTRAASARLGGFGIAVDDLMSLGRDRSEQA
jgi:Uma2 family endonuclease